MRKIAILGGGSWATALAVVLSDNGHEVSVWMRDSSSAEQFNQKRENMKYLPGVLLDQKITFSNDIEKVIHATDIVILAVGAQNIRQVISDFRSYISRDMILLNVSKGIEDETLRLVSEVVKELLPDNLYGVLSGPSHAEEVSLRIPTAIISSSTDLQVANFVQDLFMNRYFRVYTSLDVRGVELGGALKNIIALGTGISDGLEFGDNTKAALMTRGIYEISRLGEKLGANPLTFSGLSGIGDLIVTCTSMHSRNRRTGILIGEGKSLNEALKQVGMLVEGVTTTKAAFRLSQREGIDMPITSEMYHVLYHGAPISNTVYNLMLREKKYEHDSMGENQ